MRRLKELWAREPVLVAALVPVLVTLGVLSAEQASTLTAALAVVAQLVAALTARSVVTSPATRAKERAA